MDYCAYCNPDWGKRYTVNAVENEMYRYGGMQVDNGCITVNVGGCVAKFPANVCPVCGRQLEETPRISVEPPRPSKEAFVCKLLTEIAKHQEKCDALDLGKDLRKKCEKLVEDFPGMTMQEAEKLMLDKPSIQFILVWIDNKIEDGEFLVNDRTKG